MRILIIEDLPSFQKYVEKILMLEYRKELYVKSADTLEKGLKIIKEENFDIFLCDLGLPDSKGVNTIEEVRKINRVTPIVIMSAKNDEETVMGALRKDAQDYLFKTEIKRENLIRAIKYSIERKKLELKCRETASRLHAVMDSIPDLILIMDFDNNILDYYTSDSSKFLFEPEEMINKNLLDLIPDEFINLGRKHFDRAKITGEMQQYSHRFERNNIERYYDYRVKPFDNDKIMFIIRDLTKEKEFERQVFESQKMKAISNLSGSVAHEFNSLMTAVINYSELIGQIDKTSPEVKTFAGKIFDTATRAAKLSSEMLAFSSMQMFNPVEMNFNEVINNMRSIFESLAGDDIQLSYHLDHTLPNVIFDTNQFRQIIMNLILNAVHACKNQGKEIVIVSKAISSPKGIYSVLTVIDNGIGIPEENKSRIFEPFFTHGKGTNSTGLGLSVVYGILMQHDGFIEFESGINKGSKFSVYIPKKVK